MVWRVPEVMTIVPTRDAGNQNILIIKLGAFGNIVLSLAAFAAIRCAWSEDAIAESP